MRYLESYKNLILRIGVSFYFLYYATGLLFINKTSTLIEMLKIKNETTVIIIGTIALITGIMIFIGWFTKYFCYAGVIFILIVLLSGVITQDFNLLVWKEIPILAATIYLAETGCTQHGLDGILWTTNCKINKASYYRFPIVLYINNRQF